MKHMEDTTLGKLAKEILEDIDVNKLQKSMGENGDVLKTIGDPDSGFSDIISNVSQKMAKKISSGELNQENLMNDAMKFASMMPGMFGGNMGGGNMGGSNKKGPDMSHMMNMMSELMSSNNNNSEPDLSSMMQQMAGNMKNNKGSRTAVNTAGLRKLSKANKLRTKLANKKFNGE